jgi:hypothetical protein
MYSKHTTECLGFPKGLLLTEHENHKITNAFTSLYEAVKPVRQLILMDDKSLEFEYTCIRQHSLV